jgi:predicted nucleotidyltransferase
MDRNQVIAGLRAHEAELRAAGIDSLAVFGSVARGEATGASDVDVVVRLSGAAALPISVASPRWSSACEKFSAVRSIS